jgi:nucleotide-binding universal stress UspA family protein
MYKILLPIDMDQPEQADIIFAAANRIAGSRGAKLMLIHVMVPMTGYIANYFPDDFEAKSNKAAEEDLRRLARERDLPDDTEFTICRGSAAHEIVAAATKSDADLIIIAAHQPGVEDFLLGSVSAAVVRHAPCSVLVQR